MSRALPGLILLTQLIRTACAAGTGSPQVEEAVQVSFSTPEGNDLTTLELVFDPPVFEDLDGREIVRLPGEGLVGEAGRPDLPLVNRLVRIHDDAEMGLEILEEEWLSLGTHAVRPVQDRLHTEADLPLPWIQDEDLWAENAFWPGQTAELGEPMLLREIRLLKLAVYPMRWNPVTGELQRLHRLRIELRRTGSSDVNTPLRMVHGNSEFLWERRLQDLGFAKSLLGERLLLPFTVDPPPAEGALREIEWGAPSLPLNYTVFTKASALSNSSVQDFLEWKWRKGHHLTIYTEDDVNWSYSSIRSQITSDYENSETPPHYVLLIGDVSGSYSLPTHSSQYDHYYAACVGGDILGDVVVGRISVSNSTQLSTVMNKIIGYESDPWLENPGWLQRASFITGAYHCGLSMTQMSRSIAFQMVEERDYTHIDTVWCGSSPSYVYNWYEQGISFHTYRGWVNMEGLSENQIQNMDQGPRTPIAVIFTCGTGDFDYGTCFTEAFLRAGTPTTPGGAVAAMGFCTLGTHTPYNNLVTGGYYSGLLDYEIPQVGTCMFRGKLELYLNLPPGDYNISSFARWANLMGDPGMDTWCGVPERLFFEETPETLSPHSAMLELRAVDEAGLPVEGAAVCASQYEILRSIELSDVDGRVYLPLEGMEHGGDLLLTASLAGWAPVLGDVPLTSDEALPILLSLQLDDDGEDGLLSPGEATRLVPVFGNSSESEGLESFDITLEIRDGEGEVLSGVTQLPPIEPGGQGSPVDLLELRADSTLDEDLKFGLRFRFESQDRGLLIPAELQLVSPLILLQDWELASGPLYPDESGELEITLENAGNATAEELTILAGFPEGSGMLPEAQEIVLGDLAAGETALFQLTVEADPMLVPGYHTMLNLDWSDASGARSSQGLPVTLGDQQTGDPTGPDSYGYYAYESTDIEWSLAPGYNWIEIAPGAGGEGTELPIQDNGNEQDHSVLVDLPFPVVLYGRLYSEMAVCSNGFVAFGPTAHLETDFRNHYMPCSMGPEPMLAPMWDDHKVTSDAEICVQHREDLGIYIVEWYKVRTNSNNHINTFQILIYDTAHYPTGTGDNDVVFQYQQFSDGQQNSQDFPYCTIGLKDHDALTGLTFTNYNRRHPTCSNFFSGKAVRLTTTLSGTLPPPEFVLESEGLEFRLSPEDPESGRDTLRFGNTGESILVWTASARPEGDWPPEGRAGDWLRALPAGSEGRSQGGPDSFGYTWIDSEEEFGPEVGWVEIWDQGEITDFTDNDAAAGPLDPGFGVPFYGELYDEYWINPNGFICFTENGEHRGNSGGMPDEDAPDLAVAGWWDDLMHDDLLPLDNYVRWWSNDTDSLVVSWVETPHYNPDNYGGPFTFQVVVEANGRITLNYGDMSEEDDLSDSGTIGMQGTYPQGFSVLHMSQSRSDYSVRILPPFWLRLEADSGVLAPGASGVLPLLATNNPGGWLVPEGEYNAWVRFNTNDPEHGEVDVPILLHIGEVGADPRTPQARPAEFWLGRAFPNPFNPATSISFGLPRAARVEARLFNILGQEASRLLEGDFLPAGEHRLAVDGSALASGIYLLRVEALGEARLAKLMLLK